MKSTVKAIGTLDAEMYRSGVLVSQWNVRNLIVNDGLALLASRLLDNSSSPITHMAVGNDAAAAAGGDPDLGSMLGSRVGLESWALVTSAVTNDSVQYVARFLAGVSVGGITEAGLFNAATGGSMLSRVVFPVQTKTALDVLVLTWKIHFT